MGWFSNLLGNKQYSAFHNSILGSWKRHEKELGINANTSIEALEVELVAWLKATFKINAEQILSNVKLQDRSDNSILKFIDIAYLNYQNHKKIRKELLQLFKNFILTYKSANSPMVKTRLREINPTILSLVNELKLISIDEFEIKCCDTIFEFTKQLEDTSQINDTDLIPTDNLLTTIEYLKSLGL